MASEDNRTQVTRKVAIDHHPDLSARFEANYERMTETRFANAFTYGRAKVDTLLENELKRLRPGATVLDVGCGTGAYVKRFKELGFDARGVEPAPAMLERARRDNPGVQIEEGVATAIPFADQSIDFVSVIEVFRYLDLDDAHRGLAECFRVLKPGGTLFVTMVNRWALDGFYVLQRMRQVLQGEKFTREHPHCQLFSPAEVKRELASVGFEDTRMIGRLFGPMRMIYKLNLPIAAKVAKVVEPIDDLAHELAITTPFAGHLIAIARRPA